jgi:hypothetical protein
MSVEAPADQLEEWKMVSEIHTEQGMVLENVENGDENIFEEKGSSKIEEEETVFAETESQNETGNPIRIVNTDSEDQLIEIKIDGSDLEAVRAQIMHLAPMMGFEIERAEIIPNVPQENEEEKVEQNFSTLDSFRSTMSIDMRDEIKRMVQEQVQEELRKSSLVSLNGSQVLTTSAVQPEEKTEEEENQEVHIGFSCDGCGVNPIKGVRFHSMVQRNFDLCSNCEKTTHHEHPMIRFRKNTHRGLAHGRDWEKLNKIMNRNETSRQTFISHPMQRGADVIKFFTNGIANGFSRNPSNCPFQRSNRWEKCVAPSQANTCPAKNVETPVETPKTEEVRRPGLCHIRTRVFGETAPVQVPRHGRFEEFRKVFTTANPEELDAFLHKNAGLKSENELYNLACTMFLN